MDVYLVQVIIQAFALYAETLINIRRQKVPSQLRGHCGALAHQQQPRNNLWNVNAFRVLGDKR
jgi:hypothetical protein